MGGRSLERRWKAAYGRTPVAWLRSRQGGPGEGSPGIGHDTWEAVTAACGYADPSRFRAAFKAETGWSPAATARPSGSGNRDDLIQVDLRELLAQGIGDALDLHGPALLVEVA